MPQIAAVQVVIRGEDRAALSKRASPGLTLAAAGHRRRARGRNRCATGWRRLAASPPQRVLIHDGARPFVSAALIARVVGALERRRRRGAVAAVTDTLRRKTGAGYDDRAARRSVARADAAGISLRGDSRRASADSRQRNRHRRLRAWPSARVFPSRPLPAKRSNIKLTTAEDFALAERLAGFRARRYPHRHGLRRAPLRGPAIMSGCAA